MVDELVVFCTDKLEVNSFLATSTTELLEGESTNKLWNTLERILFATNANWACVSEGAVVKVSAKPVVLLGGRSTTSWLRSLVQQA